MKLGFVLPRYGVEVHGGAETAARLIAERLARRPGWSIEVFTTGAVDSHTWATELPLGTTDVNGVTVHRYASTPKDLQVFHERSMELFRTPTLVSDEDALDWLDRQGPVCPEVVDAAAASDADLVTFHPYLYWPAVHGVARLRDRAVVHPATHDEPPIYFPPFRTVFEDAGALVFWSEEERELAQRLFPAVTTHPQLVLGIGVEAEAGDAAAARAALGLGDRPYVLCLGKVTEMKGTAALARFFAAAKERSPGELTLVFAGPVADAPPAHPDVLVAGPVDEATKWGLLRGATALVSPSAYESLSLVVLEAWAAGTAVLVNGLCPPTRGHCARSGGGLWYDGFASFEVALERLANDAPLRAALGAAGRQYVERHYRWDVVLDRYSRFLGSVRDRRSRGASRVA
jgi:glycosyltransferase involved in cell wall biosynthesis